MATPPTSFPSGTFTQSTDANGTLNIGSLLGNYLGCDTMTADLAFAVNKTGIPRGNNGQNTTLRSKTSASPLKHAAQNQYDKKENKTVNAKGKSEQSIDLSISPNPNTGIFSIQFKTYSDCKNCPSEIKLYDLTGRLLLHNSNITNTTIQYDLSTYAKGCYIVCITLNNQTNFSKIIIQ